MVGLPDMVTTQMLPCGPSCASSMAPKLGAVAWSVAADSEPSGCRVAVAISSPSGPLSEAVVVYDQTSVTCPAGVASTRRPFAELGPSAFVCGDAARAPGRAARQRAQEDDAIRGAVVSPIQPMNVVPAASVAAS